MKGSSEKEKVLKLIRNSLLDKAEIPYPSLDMDIDIYTPLNDDPVMIFAENIVESGGKFIYCKNDDDLIDKLFSLIDYRNWLNHIVSYGDKLKEFLIAGGLHTNDIKDNETEVGIILCHCIAARNGSIIITSNQTEKNELQKFPNILIIIAYTSQITIDIKYCLNQLSESMPQWITTINPSYLLKEEIKELYLFTVENLIQTEN
jgi:L-lactate dehydrogenase complex protein LldG